MMLLGIDDDWWDDIYASDVVFMQNRQPIRSRHRVVTSLYRSADISELNSVTAASYANLPHARQLPKREHAITVGSSGARLPRPAAAGSVPMAARPQTRLHEDHGSPHTLITALPAATGAKACRGSRPQTAGWTVECVHVCGVGGRGVCVWAATEGRRPARAVSGCPGGG